MKPALIVMVLFIGWLTVQFFPALGRGWPGVIGGGVAVWLLYVLLSHTPERSRGDDTGREWQDHGRE